MESMVMAPFGPAVPADTAALVGARRKDLAAGKAHPFTGPLKDNTGVERVKAGEVFPLTDLGKMNWLVEGVVGQPR
jgi:basic membrane protein A